MKCWLQLITESARAMHPPQDTSRFEVANRIIAQSQKEEEARKAAALQAQARARQMLLPDERVIPTAWLG